MKKERVDVLLVQQGLAPSRERAKRLVMAGSIFDEKHQRYDKPGEKVAMTTEFYCKGPTLPYVSRGGLKLKKALEVFPVSLKGANVLDIGSSTGGFTDVSLKAGASHVYALDVGTNQLVWSLRQDPRVTVMEQTNFRYAKPEDFNEGQPHVATIDVSFISLRLMLQPLHAILADEGQVVALIKPQFEAGRDKVGKHGLVLDPKVHREVIEEVIAQAKQLAYVPLGLTYSPITGGKGNIEFLLYLKKTAQAQAIEDLNIQAVVKEAHQHL